MLRASFVLLVTLMTNVASAQVWATAVSKNEREGTAIVYRYVQEFANGFDRSTQPDRVILVWRYNGEKGMPSIEERERMEELESSLEAAVEKGGFSTLALVSTGDNLKEWTYYAKSENEFLLRLNAALVHKKRFPIEVHAGPDPQWSTYTRFISGVKQ